MSEMHKTVHLNLPSRCTEFTEFSMFREIPEYRRFVVTYKFQYIQSRLCINTEHRWQKLTNAWALAFVAARVGSSGDVDCFLLSLKCRRSGDWYGGVLTMCFCDTLVSPAIWFYQITHTLNYSIPTRLDLTTVCCMSFSKCTVNAYNMYLSKLHQLDI